jgi:hypothetical protein
VHLSDAVSDCAEEKDLAPRVLRGVRGEVCKLLSGERTTFALCTRERVVRLFRGV